MKKPASPLAGEAGLLKDVFTGKVYAYMYPAALSAPSVADMTFLPT